MKRFPNCLPFMTSSLVSLTLSLPLFLTGCGNPPETPVVPEAPIPEETSETPPESESESAEEPLLLFKVTNQTATSILGLSISADGENWQPMELGGATINGNTTVSLLWTESSCDWQIKAIFENNQESSPIASNFCQAPEVVFPAE